MPLVSRLADAWRLARGVGQDARRGATQPGSLESVKDPAGEAGVDPAATAVRHVERLARGIGEDARRGATRRGGLESVKGSVANIDGSPVEAVRKLPVDNGSGPYGAAGGGLVVGSAP